MKTVPYTFPVVCSRKVLSHIFDVDQVNKEREEEKLTWALSNRYSKPEEYGIVEVPLPKLRDNDILVKVKACGVCGTDLHIHEGEFIAKVCRGESSFIDAKKQDLVSGLGQLHWLGRLLVVYLDGYLTFIGFQAKHIGMNILA